MDAILGVVIQHQREQASLRLTRARMFVAILIVAVVAVIGVLVNEFVLTSAVTYSEAPPSIAAIENQWGYIILLPTYRPECLVYDPASVAISPDSDSSTGQSLKMALTAVKTDGCADAADSTVSIVEAPALTSLTGSVSTVSQGRMQFATVTRSVAGRTELTFQWHCSEMMCRMSSTLNGTITETVLKMMADSFQVARLPN